MNIAVLGAGMVGRTIAADLAIQYNVTSFDNNEKNLAILQATTNVTCIVANLADVDNYKNILQPFQLIVCAVPGFMGFITLKACISLGKNVADISFFNEDALLLNDLALQHNVTAIVDCGVAPGMSNFILGYQNAQFNVTSFNCVVGGLPVKRVKPFEYKAPFSPIDVIEEYTRPARYVENGYVVTKPALSDAELIHFDEVGTLESFNTDGLRSILYTMKHIPNMKEKTLRYPGHIALMQALIQAGFLNNEPIKVGENYIKPIDVTAALLFKQWQPLPNEAEFTIMKIVVEGMLDKMPKKITYTLYDIFDEVTKTPSMSRTTGYACNAFANLITQNLFTKKGVFPPELVGSDAACYNFVMQYLKNRGVEYRVEEG